MDKVEGEYLNTLVTLGNVTIKQEMAEPMKVEDIEATGPEETVDSVLPISVETTKDEGTTNIEMECTNVDDKEVNHFNKPRAIMKFETVEILDTEHEQVATEEIINTANTKTAKNVTPDTIADHNKRTKKIHDFKTKTIRANRNKPKTTSSEYIHKTRTSQERPKTRAYKENPKTRTNLDKPKTRANQEKPKTRANPGKPETRANQNEAKISTNQGKAKTRSSQSSKTKSNPGKPGAKQNKIGTIKLDRAQQVKRKMATTNKPKTVNESEPETNTEEENTSTEKCKKTRRKWIKNQCRQCKLICETPWELQKHKSQAHRNVADVKCEVCGKTNFLVYKAYYMHMRTHKSHISCEHCGKLFTASTYLNQHLNNNPKLEVLLKCSYCSKEFNRKCVLAMHIHTVHAKEDRAFACKECDKTYKTSADRDRHEKVAHRTVQKKKKIECTECGLKVVNLLQHVRYKHTKKEESNVKPIVIDAPPPIVLPNSFIQCDICGNVFKQKHAYLEHQAAHTGIGLYLCEYCGKTFNKRSNLRQHLFSHTGERPYTCAYCPKGFVAPEDLNRHIRTHTGEKPFKCNLCDSSFAQKGALNSHYKKKHII